MTFESGIKHFEYLNRSVPRDYQGKRVNPHIGPLTRVIRLKLFLDIVPSSSENITRAIRGQPKRLSRNYLRKNGGNVISYVLVLFHTGDVFCTLSRPLVQSGISFAFLLVWLFIILPFIRF